MPPTLDPRVDAYIERAPAFARPILEKLRKAVHKACPQTVEAIKWGSPHFQHHGLMVSMSAFKAHVSYGFWRGDLVGDPRGILEEVGNGKMCASRIGSLRDLPTQKVLVEYVKRAARINEEHQQAPKPAGRAPAKPRRTAPRTPADLAAGLKRNAAARRTFEGFSPSRKRDYVHWLTEAKQAATRERRLKQALEWMAEGKARNWKYERC